MDRDTAEQPSLRRMDKAMIVITWNDAGQVDVVGKKACEGRISDPLDLRIEPSTKQFGSAQTEQTIRKVDLRGNGRPIA